MYTNTHTHTQSIVKKNYSKFGNRQREYWVYFQRNAECWLVDRSCQSHWCGRRTGHRGTRPAGCRWAGPPEGCTRPAGRGGSPLLSTRTGTRASQAHSGTPHTQRSHCHCCSGGCKAQPRPGRHSRSQRWPGQWGCLWSPQAWWWRTSPSPEGSHVP